MQPTIPISAICAIMLLIALLKWIWHLFGEIPYSNIDAWSETYDREAMIVSREELEELYDDVFADAMELKRQLD
jgi:hypothetical protein